MNFYTDRDLKTFRLRYFHRCPRCDAKMLIWQNLTNKTTHGVCECGVKFAVEDLLLLQAIDVDAMVRGIVNGLERDERKRI